MILNNTQKIYFPNLNGLRFIAALFVIINHVEQILLLFEINELPISKFSKIIGKLGVMLFFVLSGFLITFLLLKEEYIFNKIDVKKFYLRRILRILPLYFLLIFIVFGFVNQNEFWDLPYTINKFNDNYINILILHLLCFPNLAASVFGFIPYLAQTWSIGTEEQVYLLWPLLLRNVKNRINLMIGIIVLYFLIKALLYLLGQLFTNSYLTYAYGFIARFNIDIIAVGSLAAIFYINQSKLLNYIVNLKLFYLTVILTIALLLNGIQIPLFHYQFYSILFVIIILNLATNKKLKSSFLECKLLSFLGKISYGIYLTHFIVLIFVVKFCFKYDMINVSLIYFLTISITIIISSISFYIYERPFLKLKIKFTKVRNIDV